MEQYNCNLCTANYSNNRNLYRHIRCKNQVDVDEKFTCVLCGYSSPRADSLKCHENAVHKTECKNIVLCALCDFGSSNRNGMLQHYSLLHDLVIREENHEFCDQSKFYEWKRELEKDTVSEFVHVRGQCNKSADGSSKLYFKCHRDGNYRPRGSNKRHLKLMGSNKIGGHCPSTMDVTHYPSGQVKVIFCSTHVGRLRLSRFEREEIAKKIAMEIPFDHILGSLRYPIQDSGFQHHNLLSRKDIHNVAQSYNLMSDAIRHKNDCTSVESWVREM
ncbi:uncharacterized protein LOC126212617 [Schistocerca nitens]|uniref:uncharacterized protein LOC126212617 n=1 Tax=Schistocerca nitens TaxID=7011 RepID=UPI00211777B0|nr:uncharacterized protein LOC126212617 [Schistocerca nitens]